jgi:DNA repair exonuclease SbcCD ATPase subunit
MSDTAVGKPIPVKDRTELRRILKARFEILAQQLQEREQEVRTQLQEEIEAEYKDAVKQAQKRATALRRKADKIHAEVAAFHAKMEAKAKELQTEGRELQEEMEELGVVPTYHDRYYGRRTSAAVHIDEHSAPSASGYITVADRWEPSKLQDRINKGMNEVSRQAGLHKLDLRMKELELAEELAIGSLTSDEAQGFVAKIPNIDNILPAGKDTMRTALEAANTYVIDVVEA